jgi:2-oxoglutarate/2-oxoacid ferredoxin oxidoreductase subunit beta
MIATLSGCCGGPSAEPPLTVKDFRSDLKPIWCPGCGDFGVVTALYRALAKIGRPPHEIAFISGIGCSSRIPGYTTAYGFNTVHGRALPVAQGIKMANPDLLVLVAGGDGDGFSIGGGHVPHAIRRNLDLTYIVMDNHIYGLTKGQLSPTSQRGAVTSSTPRGAGGTGEPAALRAGLWRRLRGAGRAGRHGRADEDDRGGDPLSRLSRSSTSSPPA